MCGVVVEFGGEIVVLCGCPSRCRELEVMLSPIAGQCGRVTFRSVSGLRLKLSKHLYPAHTAIYS